MKNPLNIIVLIILIFYPFLVVAQEDVCEGLTEDTVTQGTLFELCWKRNHPNDHVDHYGIFKSTTSEVYDYGPDHKNYWHSVPDDTCMEIHCFSGPLSITEIGTYYMVVVAYDNTTFHSDDSNEVVLTVEITVVGTPIQLRITNVVKEE